MAGGKLVLCGTPIGNLEDLSPRALGVLSEARVVACEDTRRTRKLLSHHGIHVRELVAYHEGNERRAARELVGRALAGDRIVVVSDAGMPGLSDPGYRLVRAAIDAGIEVEVVPGPNAAVTALVVSGLPPARFTFEGFLPRKAGDRRRRIEELASEMRTIVLYESPHRIEETLADLSEVLGGRPAALVRELTKLHEEVRRGALPELLESVRAEAPRGEIVLVIGGAVGGHKPQVTREELARRARELMASGVHRKQAMTEVARAARVSKREVFDALIAEKEGET